MKPTQYILVSISFALASGLGVAHATPFCAGSAAEIQAALNSAASNGQNDFIQVVAGTYLLNSGLYFNSSQANNITVFGGFSAGCVEYTGAPTILDGQDTVRPLYITNSNGGIHVERLTFQNGLSTNNRGGGLNVTSDTGDIRIDLNRFIGNRADDFAGGLEASTAGGGQLLVRNNLMLANSAAYSGAAELFQLSGEAIVTGNTVVFNNCDHASVAGGILISGGSHYTLSNNILWNNTQNGGLDLDARTAHSRFSNDIGSIGGDFAVPDTAQGELSVEPGFASCGFLCFSFELSRSSPLVDAGVDSPPGENTGLDLAQKSRIIGPHIDIGAYEDEAIFANGFE
jgi:hypothetical protein